MMKKLECSNDTHNIRTPDHVVPDRTNKLLSKEDDGEKNNLSQSDFTCRICGEFFITRIAHNTHSGMKHKGMNNLIPPTPERAEIARQIAEKKRKLWYLENRKTVNQKRKNYKRQAWEDRADNPKNKRNDKP